MESSEPLRPCPFCGHEKPTLVAAGEDRVRVVVVTCCECGAFGPPASGDEPPGIAEHGWNSRDGLQ